MCSVRLYSDTQLLPRVVYTCSSIPRSSNGTFLLDTIHILVYRVKPPSMLAQVTVKASTITLRRTNGDGLEHGGDGLLGRDRPAHVGIAPIELLCELGRDFGCRPAKNNTWVSILIPHIFAGERMDGRFLGDSTNLLDRDRPGQGSERGTALPGNDSVRPIWRRWC